MRTSDIWQAKQNPAYVRTERMYLDKDKPVEELSLDELRIALCGKANGDVLACESCDAKCRYGRRIVELLKPVEMEKEEPKRPVKHDVKHKQSMVRLLKAIASGDPLRWAKEHGYRSPYDIRARAERAYPGVSAEEAKRRLAEMGVELASKPEHVQEVLAVAAVPVAAPHPVQKAKLKVSVVDGEYFNFSLYCGQLKMTSGQGSILVNAGDIAAMCAEIAQAAEMMGVQ